MQYQQVPQQPNGSMLTGQSGIVNSGNTAVLLAATAGVQYQVWYISLSMACGTDGTPAATSTQQVSMTVVEHTSGLVILRCNAFWGGTVGTANPVLEHDLGGLIVPAGDGLDVAVGATAAGFQVDASANITYTKL